MRKLETVLEAFVTEDADGDGDATNEIGYTNSAGSTVLSGDLRNILFPFGTMVSRADNYMGLNSDGEPVFMPAQENYKDAVIWMHGLWEKEFLILNTLRRIVLWLPQRDKQKAVPRLA